MTTDPYASSFGIRIVVSRQVRLSCGCDWVLNESMGRPPMLRVVQGGSYWCPDHRVFKQAVWVQR